MKTWLDKARQLFFEKFGFNFKLVEVVYESLSKAPYIFKLEDNEVLFPIHNISDSTKIVAKVFPVTAKDSINFTKMSDWLQLVVTSQIENSTRADILNVIENNFITNNSTNVLKFSLKQNKSTSTGRFSLFNLYPDQKIKSQNPILLYGDDYKNLFFLAQEIHDLSKNMMFINFDFIDGEAHKLYQMNQHIENSTIYIPDLTKLNIQKLDSLSELIKQKNSPLILVGTTKNAQELHKNFKFSKSFLNQFIFCHFLSSNIDFSPSYRERLRRSALLALGSRVSKLDSSIYTLKCPYTRKYFFLPFSSKLITKLENTTN